MLRSLVGSEMCIRDSLRCVRLSAVSKEKFFFRRNFYGENAKDDKYMPKSRNKSDIQIKKDLFLKNELIELTLEELLLGGDNHQGFKGLIEEYISLNKDFLNLESKKTNENIIDTIWDCFDFFLKRSQGKLLTTAGLMRKYVNEPVSYTHLTLPTKA